MENINRVIAGSRIKSKRLEKGLTLSEIGNIIGVAPSTVQRYESGAISRPKIPVLKAIAAVLDVSFSWLVGGIGEECLPSNAFEANLQNNVRIPVIGRVAAGLACYADQYIEDYEYASADDINPNCEYVYLRVKGDSMSPLIMEDDLVLVRCQDIVDSGTYAVVIIDNEDGVVKRVYMSKDTIELRSVNPYYPPRIFEGEERSRVRIFGKVVECKRKF